jgi:DNA-3-methyladenine glycosylase
MNRFSHEYFLQQGDALAPRLLGQRLVHESPEGITTGRIVEVESYIGPNDRAAHSYDNRKSVRTQIQYEPGGPAYIYQIYGMYYCFNVVCANRDQPECVLVRALEPLEGLPLMAQRLAAARGKSRKKSASEIDRDAESLLEKSESLCQGPGKLSLAMGIGREQYGLCLRTSELYLQPDLDPAKLKIATTPRINIDYAGPDICRHRRYILKDNLSVSGKRSLNQSARRYVLKP